MNSDLYKLKLLAKEQELEAEIARLKTDAVESRSAEVEDPIDSVTSAQGQATAFEESSMASDTLTAVRDALQRIKGGRYGRCIDCGEEIGTARLNAVPWTPYCIRDQEKHDQLKSTSGDNFFAAVR
jgi:DnaK suppressor protein